MKTVTSAEMDKKQTKEEKKKEEKEKQEKKKQEKEEKKKQEKEEKERLKKQKAAEKSGQSSRDKTTGEVTDNPLITVNTDGQATGRKVSLAEKKESDRVVVKEILYEAIREENKQNLLGV